MFKDDKAPIIKMGKLYWKIKAPFFHHWVKNRQCAKTRVSYVGRYSHTRLVNLETGGRLQNLPQGSFFFFF